MQIPTSLFPLLSQTKLFKSSADKLSKWSQVIIANLFYNKWIHLHKVPFCGVGSPEQNHNLHQHLHPSSCYQVPLDVSLSSLVQFDLTSSRQGWCNCHPGKADWEYTVILTFLSAGNITKLGQVICTWFLKVSPALWRFRPIASSLPTIAKTSSPHLR